MINFKCLVTRHPFGRRPSAGPRGAGQCLVPRPRAAETVVLKTHGFRDLEILVFISEFVIRGRHMTILYNLYKLTHVYTNWQGIWLYYTICINDYCTICSLLEEGIWHVEKHAETPPKTRRTGSQAAEIRGIYIYIYMYICIHTYIHTYIYIYAYQGEPLIWHYFYHRCYSKVVNNAAHSIRRISQVMP